ncbi:MAG: pseudouridine synthase [Myxococcota bacterium]
MNATLRRVFVEVATPRTDTFVAAALGVSRAEAKTWCRAGRVHRDGRRLRGADPLQPGDALDVSVPATDEAAPPLTTLHVGPDFVYVAKPAGIHTVRLRHEDAATLADAVAAAHPECRDLGRPGEAGAVHRLDRETSGVVAFARNAAAYARGRSAVTAGAWKLYLARTKQAPWPPPGRGDVHPLEATPRWPDVEHPAAPHLAGVRVDASLARSGSRGERMQVDRGGQPATSWMWPIDDAAPDTIAVQLRTGRRHQIRVHLAYLGRPILGDARYGTGAEAPSRALHLHAWALQLDPQTAVVHAPLPTWW